MSGISSFFRSESFSDTKLLLVLAHKNSAALLADVSQPAFQTTPCKLSAVGSKRKAGLRDELDDRNDGVVVCIPAHKLILQAKSSYMSVRLSTAVGEGVKAVIREHADSMQQLRAMEAVLEFMYTDLLPKRAVTSKGTCLVSNSTHMHSLLLMLLVSDRWQVHSCLTACCSAICALNAEGMAWDDCFSLFNLPEGMKEQTDVARVMTYAAAIAVTLANLPGTTVTQMQHAALSTKLHKLPASARLALLKGCKLGYLGMRVLLSSNEMVTESEDSLALILARYIRRERGDLCTPEQTKDLKYQLRYQHMSHRFLGLELPGIPALCLDSKQLSQLMYLRGLQGGDRIPTSCQLGAFPPEWYQPRRQQAPIPPVTINLTLKISESILASHLKAAELLLSGGVAASDLDGAKVDVDGVSWCLSMRSRNPGSRLWVGVLPISRNPRPYETKASNHVGTYASIDFCLDSSTPPIIASKITEWIPRDGLSFSNQITPKICHRPGDQMDIAWWKDFLADGYLCMRATLTFLTGA